MQFHLKALVAAAALASSGFASAITISGLTLPDGLQIHVGTVYENIVTAPGQILSGYGSVGQITDGSGTKPLSAYCTGCELTFSFGGYRVESITSPTDVTFSGGWVNFYVDNAPDFSKDSAGTASDGVLLLTLAGRGLSSGAVNVGGGLPQGRGNGVADVDFTGMANGNTAGAGAAANAFFNSNSFNGADALFNSSFTVYSGGSTLCPNNGPCVVGSADMTVAAIPEPETYALMLAGIGVIGLMAKRRRVNR